jgi:FtsP/CotA-like multicopper oxidase with cupredoxin domain
MSIFQITALLGLVTFIPSSSKAARVEYTLVIHHQDVDTIDPVTNETYSRLGTFINETYPGPTLEANLGDEVVIKVINDMPTSSTAIHFHGQHQEGSFFSDGVPDITQCEIPAGPGSSFEYVFTAEPAGTFAYHSHNPYQVRDDGIFIEYGLDGDDTILDDFG